MSFDLAIIFLRVKKMKRGEEEKKKKIPKIKIL